MGPLEEQLHFLRNDPNSQISASSRLRAKAPLTTAHTDGAEGLLWGEVQDLPRTVHYAGTFQLQLKGDSKSTQTKEIFSGWKEKE